MPIQPLLPGLWMLPSRGVNLFLLEDDDDLVLIDTGIAETASEVAAEIKSIGRDIRQVRRILITHLHPDHTGGLNIIKQQCQARAAMHPLDAELARCGQFGRPAKPAPGLLKAILVRLFMQGDFRFAPVEIEDELRDGELLPYAGGLRVIHAQGHTAGLCVFLWEPRRVLICGDACANMFRLDYHPLYENFEQGKETLRRLSSLDFDAAVFSHGKPILSGAAQAFRKRFI